MQAAGVMSGTVTDNNDPNQMGRVQVNFPSMGGEVSSSWARVVQPLAGNAYGHYFLPEVGDEVLVAFDNNNLDNPIVIGSLYNGANTQSDTSDSSNYIKNIKTKAGNEIRFLDKPGSEQITITNKTANDNQIILTVANSGEITIQSNGKIELTAPEIDLTANKTFSIKGGEVTIQGSKISLTSDGDLALSGAKVAANANANIELTATADLKMSGMNISGNANAQLSLQGTATAQLTASGETTIKGAIVMIN